jgi:hypothetical protein
MIASTWRWMSPDQLAETVAEYASTPRLWRGAVRHDTSHRWYVRLAWSLEHEVWLLGWTAGQAVGLHDHGHAAGAFVVTEGALCEDHVAGARLRRLRHEPAGGRSFAPGHVHTILESGTWTRDQHSRLCPAAPIDGVLRPRPETGPSAHQDRAGGESGAMTRPTAPSTIE